MVAHYRVIGSRKRDVEGTVPYKVCEKIILPYTSLPRRNCGAL